MKKRLPNLLMGFFAVLLFNAAKAQTYQPMVVSTGFNADVIANGVGSASATTSIAVDNANYNFMANNYQATSSSTAPAYALPSTGLINSEATPGLTFQLGSLSENNSLRIPSNGVPGTLTFSNPVSATKLYLLVTSGSGAATVTITVNFSDETSQVVTGAGIPDWFFSSALPIVTSGFGRVNRTTDVIENPVGDPRLYQFAIEIDAANQAKTVSGVQVTKTSMAEGIVNVFGATAEVLGTCPSPSGLTSVVTPTAATINWNAAVIVPDGGYDYYYSTSATPPTDETEPIGNVAAGTNTVNLSPLPTGILHFFWVRSNCSETDKGPWQITTFTPGQATGTYSAGDISSEYFNIDEETIDVTSFTPCPGVMTLNIPDGYQISSVSTSYTMTAANNAYQTEQRTLLVCTTTNTTEEEVTVGPSVSAGGTVPYTRTGLDIANGATGAVQFELRAWRGWGSSLETGCGVLYNKIDNNSWTITAVYEPIICDPIEAPEAEAQTICPSVTVANLEATGAPGAVFKWYTEPTGGTALASNSTLTTSGNYYVAQKIGNCESSERTEVAITVAPTPGPTVEAQAHCAGATVSDLIVTPAEGGIVKWYLVATGGGALTGATVLVSTTYYVTQTMGGCESARIPVVVTINANTQPVAAAQTHCPGSTVENLMATGVEGAVLKWYADLIGGAELDAATVLETDTYYVSQLVGDCESTRKPVEVTIEALDLPTATAQTHCFGATVSDLIVTGVTDATFSWYAEPTGDVELDPEMALETGTYYVSQSLNECTSDRKTVEVTVNAELALPMADNQILCSGSTVADLSATGTTDASIQWYTGLTSEEPLSDDAALASGPYYVSQMVGDCESARKEITVTVSAELGLPDAENQTVCSGSTVADLSATGNEDTTIKWYSGLTGGTELSSTTTLVAGPYYVSQASGDCESARKEITVTVTSATTPIVLESYTYCEGSTIADIALEGIVTGADVNWTTTEGEPLTMETILQSDTYLVSQTIGDCESGIAEVHVTITEVPEAPGIDAEQDFESGETLAALEVEYIEGAILHWYILDEDVYVSISGSTELVDGTTYYVTQKVGICESDYFGITVNEILDVETFNSKNIVVHPNPVTDVLTVSANSTLTEIVVTNLLGQEVMREKVNGDSVQVNVSRLPQASYILQVYSENGAFASIKIVKQ